GSTPDSARLKNPCAMIARGILTRRESRGIQVNLEFATDRLQLAVVRFREITTASWKRTEFVRKRDKSVSDPRLSLPPKICFCGISLDSSFSSGKRNTGVHYCQRAPAGSSALSRGMRISYRPPWFTR